MNLHALVLAPYGKDAAIISRVLAPSGIEGRTCRDVEQLAAELEDTTGAILLAEEAIETARDRDVLQRALDAQPAWAEVSVLLLGRAGEEAELAPGLRRVFARANLVVLERPLRVRALVSAVQSAVRGRQRQLEVRDLLGELEQANRLKDEFLAVVSHELRTPLNAILGWSSILKQGELPAERVARGLDTIERNARAQVRLIEDLLDASRAVTGKLTLRLESVDPAAPVRDAVDALRSAAASRGVALEVNIDAGGPPMRVDATRLQQIAWNLVSNAIKFTPAGGRVEVRLDRHEDGVELVVCDTGRGIDPDFLPHVFERFRQQDAATTRSHGGLGLGLAIVRHLAELHGGYVLAESEGEGCGATFRVRIPSAALAVEPARAADVPPGGATQPVVPVAPLRGVRIVVVDDDPDARTLLDEVLRAAGATVRTAGSAREGLSAVTDFRPHLVVADIAMPEEDGYAFVQRLRKRAPDAGGATPAIALTAYTREEDRSHALVAGFTRHVAKPVDPAHLLVEVAQALSRAPSA